ncbi:hypothetical protein BV394_16085 (plasmid) [Brevirhabdus pacifica]|uniref:Uncharacterized protein n=1 Tax=Brevirhabdus pacifica TaxID=1267768 RepID=A0A1P8QYD6_9RHOB|nr:glycosyltransferase [Brevirhabdus pacifica]APX91409.1 hypothetical protein BV394_16085 [Brevirhabdus pacifica]PJJ78961.1 succinoglycan biosynthesis protein ExoA [Brevirhabdus pacifica]
MDDHESPCEGPVFVAIPVLDEAAHLTALVDFLAEERRACAFEALILDGGSRDGSRALARRLAAPHPWLHLRDNPARHQAAALNRAASWAIKRATEKASAQEAACLIRIDAHARYPAGFVKGLVRGLHRGRADSVVVPLVATAPPGAPPWQRALAALQRHWLGHGGARHRLSPAPDLPLQRVDHGHHAAFRLARFAALGGYDPRFRANEDAEYDLRLARAGGRILFDPARPVAYLPRRDPAALARQMWRNGIWRGRCLRLHRARPAPRQLLPLGLALTALATPGVLLWAGPVAGLPLGAYGALLLAATRGMESPWRAAVLAALSHLAFGAGLAVGLLTPPRVPSAAEALA